MVENENDLEIEGFYVKQKRSKLSTNQGRNIKMSLIYALLFDSLLIFACISFICLFYIIGGILLNPLLIFGSLIIILLFALIETMNLAEKNILEKKKKGVKSHVKNH